MILLDHNLYCKLLHGCCGIELKHMRRPGMKKLHHRRPQTVPYNIYIYTGIEPAYKLNVNVTCKPEDPLRFMLCFPRLDCDFGCLQP